MTFDSEFFLIGFHYWHLVTTSFRQGKQFCTYEAVIVIAIQMSHFREHRPGNKCEF